MPTKQCVGSNAQRQYEKVEEGEGVGRAGGEGDGDGEWSVAQFHIEVETDAVNSRRSIFRRKPSGGEFDLHKKKSSDSPTMMSRISSPMFSVEATSSPLPVQVVPLKSSNHLEKMSQNEGMKSPDPSSWKANPLPDHRRSSSRQLPTTLTAFDRRQDACWGHLSDDPQTKRPSSLPSSTQQSHAALVAGTLLPRAPLHLNSSLDSGKVDKLSGISQSQDQLTIDRSTRSNTRPHLNCDHSVNNSMNSFERLTPSICSTKVSRSLDPNVSHYLQINNISHSSHNSCPKVQLTSSTNAQHFNASPSMHSDQERTKTSNALAHPQASRPTPETARNNHLRRQLHLPTESSDKVDWSDEAESCRLISDSQCKEKCGSISTRPTIVRHDIQSVKERHFEMGFHSPKSVSPIYSCRISTPTDNNLSCRSSPDYYRIGYGSPRFNNNRRSQASDPPNESMDIRSDSNLRRADLVNSFGKISSQKNTYHQVIDSTILSDRSIDDGRVLLPASNYTASTIIDKHKPAKDLLLIKHSFDNRNKNTNSVINENRSYSSATHDSISLHSNSTRHRFHADVLDTHRKTLSPCRERINARQYSNIKQAPENNRTMIHKHALPHIENEHRVSIEDPLSHRSIDLVNSQKARIRSTTSFLSTDTDYRIQQQQQQQQKQQSGHAASGNASTLRPSLTTVQNATDQSYGKLKILPMTSVKPRSFVKDTSSTERPGQQPRLKSSYIPDFVKFLPVRLPAPIEVPRIIHNRKDSSEWQRAQTAFANDQLGNVKKSRSLDCVLQTTKTHLQRTVEHRPISPIRRCHKTQKLLDHEITSTDSVAFKESKYRKDATLGFPDDDGGLRWGFNGSDRMGAGNRDQRLESMLRFSRSVNEDYCRLVSQKQPNFTAVIYFERPANYNQQLHLIKTELALSALIHFFYPCSSANVFWTTDIRKQLSTILNDKSTQSHFRTKFSGVFRSCVTDQASTNAMKNRSQPVRTGVNSQLSRDRPELIGTSGRIIGDLSALDDVTCKCILLLSSDAGRLLRHKQTSLLRHIATALATDVEDIVVLVKVSEKQNKMSN